MRWTVVIPVKALPAAKSRLVAAAPDAGTHARLVEAIRADTVDAARATPEVARVLLVSDVTAPGSDGVATIVQLSSGLNGALRDAADHAVAHWPDDGVAALLGDLPALRPAELSAVLRAAGRHDRAFVPDAAGTGTTLLTARPHVSLDPAFGEGSAARHALAARRLTAGPSVRLDVDTADDLAAAAGLGLGPHTAACRAGIRSRHREMMAR